MQRETLPHFTSPLLETLLGLALITVVNLLFYQDNIGFIDSIAHPYWIVVLLISVRYGFLSGIQAGVLSGLLYMAIWFVHTPDITFLEIRSFRFWGRPVLFVAVGFVLGEIRQIHIRQQHEAETRYAETLQAYEKLEKQYKTLESAKQEMDGRIISQQQTLSTLYDAAQALRSLKESDIYLAVLKLLEEYLSVDEATLYTIENNEFILRAQISAQGRVATERLPLDTGLMGAAVAKQKTASLNQYLREDGMPLETLIASPITHPSEPEVLGVITVDNMPFLKFNQEGVKMVSLLADWCGSSILNARIHEDTKAKLILDEVLHAYTREYLDKRLFEEFSRCRRYKLPLSLLYMRLPVVPDILLEKKEDLLVAFSMTLLETTRNVDLLFITGVEGEFVLVLPNTPLEGAHVVGRNIRRTFRDVYMERLKGAGLSLDIHIGYSQFEQGMTAHTQLIDKAREELPHA